MAGTVKFAPEIDAELHKEFVSAAKERGQSQRYLLERALEHYLHNVVPSQQLIRPETMKAFRKSKEKNRKLLEMLAK